MPPMTTTSAPSAARSRPHRRARVVIAAASLRPSTRTATRGTVIAPSQPSAAGRSTGLLASILRMRVEAFGTCSAGAVQRITIGADDGLQVHVLDLGATLQTVRVVGGDGERRNVALGHATAEEYVASTAYLGATVGRYANRIAGGRFDLDGEPVQVGTNDRGNSLHGGPDGFDARVWEVVDGDDSSVVLRLTSPDGDQGFPGTVVAEARYRVEGSTLHGELTATTDAPTVLGLTNHAYWNLDGEGSGSCDHHRLQVLAQRYLPVDATGIPLGGLEPVAGSPFDLRQPVGVGDAVRTDHPQVRAAGGIDHCYVPDGEGLRPVAVLESDRSRTRLELLSDQPALQVYTGNFLDGTLTGTSGRLYRQGDGVALEPELYPDSPNRPDFPSAVLRPGQTYRSTLQWRFSPTG